MRRPKFEKYSNQKHPGGPREYRWRLRAGNGEIVAQGEGYTTPSARNKGIRTVRWLSTIARVVEHD